MDKIWADLRKKGKVLKAILLSYTIVIVALGTGLIFYSLIAIAPKISYNLLK